MSLEKVLSALCLEIFCLCNRFLYHELVHGFWQWTWEWYAWANLVPGRLEVPVSMGTPMKAASRPSAVSWYGNLAMVAIPDTRATNSLLGGTLYVMLDISLLGVAVTFPFTLTLTTWSRIKATHDLSWPIPLIFMKWNVIIRLLFACTRYDLLSVCPPLSSSYYYFFAYCCKTSAPNPSWTFALL